jgi:hypothetical protein
MADSIYNQAAESESGFCGVTVGDGKNYILIKDYMTNFLHNVAF